MRHRRFDRREFVGMAARGALGAAAWGRGLPAGRRQSRSPNSEVRLAVIGFGEPSRAARWANVVLGAWLVAAPWVLWDDTSSPRWHEPAAGVLIVLLSIRRGPVEGRFGGWDPYVV